MALKKQLAAKCARFRNTKTGSKEKDFILVEFSDEKRITQTAHLQDITCT